MTNSIPGALRSRKRNSKKNRSEWAKTSHLRRRPLTAGDFDDLKKPAPNGFKWTKA